MRQKLKLTGTAKPKLGIPAKLKTSVSHPKLKQLWPNRSFNLAESITVNNALISSIGEGLIIVNEYGEITHINQLALDILGYDRKDMEGKWLPQALPSYDIEGTVISASDRPLLEALLTGRTVSGNLKYKRKDGSLVPVFSTSSPFMLEKKPLGAIIVFRDISKEVQIERAKDEFVSLASHQLRTPLTSIKFFAELLKDPYYGKLSKKQVDYLDKISFSTERMISLVSDLLNISRLNLGRLEIKPISTNINNLVQNQIIELTPQARSNGVKVGLAAKLPRDESTMLDRTLFAQVIHNLVSNAIRYSQTSKNGQVNVSLKKTTRFYEISVADNGIGIPKSADDKIYQRFYRADNAVKTYSEGTGLGLYLVKVIVEASGGAIRHKTNADKGTTFIIDIPLSGMTPTEVSTVE